MQHVVADVGLRRKRFHHGLSRCLDSERRPVFAGLPQGRGGQERLMRRHPMAPVNVVRISVATSGTDFTAYRCTRVRSTTTKCTRGRGCNGHPAFPTPSLGGRFINASGASRGEVAKLFQMNRNPPHSPPSSPAKEPVKDTDLILRSLRSKRLEGWTQRRDSRPSFETRARGALLRMRSEIYSEPRKRRSSIPRRQ